MSDLDRAAVLDALDAVYQNVTAVAGGLGEADLMRPSRCAAGPWRTSSTTNCSTPAGRCARSRAADGPHTG